MAWKYSTPGHEDSDLPDGIKDLWHARMAGIARDGVLELSQQESDGGIIPFIDPTAPSGVPDQRRPTPVVWPGFPAQVALAASDPQQALIATEDHGISDLDSRSSPAVEMVDASGAPIDGRVRHRQDEYLEWEAEHDADGRLVAVTFVAEGHDYWSFLFEHAPEKVAKMFQDSTGNGSIQPDDLRAKSEIIVVHENGRRQSSARASTTGGTSSTRGRGSSTCRTPPTPCAQS